MATPSWPGSSRAGCFSVAATVDDRKVPAFCTGNLPDAEGQIARRLGLAVETGELPASFPVRKRTRLTINTMLALAAELLVDAADGTALILA